MEDVLDSKNLRDYYQTSILNIKELLDYYEKNEWDLVKLEENSKASYEDGWQNKENKNKLEWINWIKGKSNIGVKTGERSGITALDIDLTIIPIEISSIMGDALIQKTSKDRYHLIYKYESDLSDFDFFDDNGNKIVELRNSEGRQIVIAPSIVEGKKRYFVDLIDIPKMPEELKSFLIRKIKNKDNKLKDSHSNSNNEYIQRHKEPIGSLTNGNRNTGLTKLAGYIRSLCNFEQTSKIIHKLNDDGIVTPSLRHSEVNSILRSVSKYEDKDIRDLAYRILEYLEKAEEANERDLAEVLKEDRKDLVIALDYLIKEDFIIKSNRLYKCVEKIIWHDGVPSEHHKEIDFHLPYFGDNMTFSYSDMAILLANSGTGKTSLCANITKSLIEQGVTPYVITTEAGSRLGKTFETLGVKNGTYKWTYVNNPLNIKIPNKAVVILDWLSLAGVYNEADKIFANIAKQLEKTQSFLICFMQLRKSDSYNKSNLKQERLSNLLPAKNLVDQYASFVAIHSYIGTDRVYSKWEMYKLRDADSKNKAWSDVILRYDKKTKLIEKIDDSQLPESENQSQEFGVKKYDF